MTMIKRYRFVAFLLTFLLGFVVQEWLKSIGVDRVIRWTTAVGTGAILGAVTITIAERLARKRHPEV